MTVPPLSLFKVMPGFDRLDRARKLAAVAAFRAEDMVRWMKAVRRAGTIEVDGPDLIITAEGYARDLETSYRERVVWWGGRAER